jgi:hypothetical protein
MANRAQSSSWNDNQRSEDYLVALDQVEKQKQSLARRRQQEKTKENKKYRAPTKCREV